MAKQKWLKTHEDAKNKTIFYLKQNFKLMIRPEYPILIDNKYRHQYDIVGFLDDDVITYYEDETSLPTEIPIRKFLRMSDRELVYSEYKGLLDEHVRVVIEIDNLTSHTHTEHAIADNIAKEAAYKTFHKDLRFIRLLKEEVNGKENDMLKYMYDNVDTKLENLV